MRQVVSADHRPELDLTVVVDPSADAVDWDAALAKFLLATVRRSAGTAEVEVDPPERQTA